MYCTIRNYNTDCNIKRVLVENRKPELGENDLSAETVVEWNKTLRQSYKNNKKLKIASRPR